MVTKRDYYEVLEISRDADEATIKSLRNIEKLTLRVAPAFSTRDVVDGGQVILTRGAVQKVEALLGEGTVPGATTEEASNA